MAFLVATTSLPAVYRPNGYARTTTAATPHARANRHGLVVVDGVVTYKRRLVIPEKLRGMVLETLHAAHQGVSGMINRAEQSVFWTHITMDIERMRATCRTCVRNSPLQPAGKPVAPPSPSYPFKMLAIAI